MSRKVLYIVGPTCSGKSSIARALQEKYGYGTVKSTMTRQSRDSNDINLFLDKTTFETYIKEDKFLEHATYSNEYYGTLRESVFDAFKEDKVLSVKVIEVNGLVQILQSGFHESSGIDFFIVYLKPQFEGYEDTLKTRTDWEQRIEEDKELYSLFLKTIRSLVPKKKYKVMLNRGSINKVTSDINMLCISNNRTYESLRNMLKIPESVEISNKYDGTSSYALTLIDSNYSQTTQNFYLSSVKYFNAIRYMSEVFDKDVHYQDDEYIAISLNSNGMLAVLCKERSGEYLQKKVP